MLFCSQNVILIIKKKTKHLPFRQEGEYLCYLTARKLKPQGLAPNHPSQRQTPPLPAPPQCSHLGGCRLQCSQIDTAFHSSIPSHMLSFSLKCSNTLSLPVQFLLILKPNSFDMTAFFWCHMILENESFSKSRCSVPIVLWHPQHLITTAQLGFTSYWVP